ncbi:MAG: haloacid dehalogenase type II [Actinomycetia bacterium]|nr:haloacid dehalogenase type II [Actinomycetes bacterium]
MTAVFDVYGTLLDLAALEVELRRRFGEAGGPFLERWRRAQLEYSWLHTLTGPVPPFEQVTAAAAAWALESLGLSGDPEELTRLWRTALAAYPDVPAALDALAALGVPRIVLSNGDGAALAAALTAAGVIGAFDRILSAGEAGAFKPDPRVYRLAVEALGVEPAAVWFFSSNFWDVFGAKRFGFRVAWVRRRPVPADHLGVRPDAVLASLAEAPALFARPSQDA